MGDRSERIPSVAAVVLNWNNAPDSLACIQSLMDATYSRLEVLVVDNASTDNSVELITGRFPQITLLQNAANLGYAGGVNVGVRHALKGEYAYLCILNNDIVVDQDFLSPLVTALEKDTRAGAAVPTVADLAVPDRIWALGAQLDSSTATISRLHAGDQVAALKNQSPFEVDCVQGAAFIARRELWESVGLLDEPFFLYFEEMDWSLRVQRAGYRILAVPESLVWHKVSATLSASSPIVDYYMIRNHLRLIRRHWQGAAREMLSLRWLVRSLASVAAFTVKPHAGRRLPHRDARLRAIRDALLGRYGPRGQATRPQRLDEDTDV